MIWLKMTRRVIYTVVAPAVGFEPTEPPFNTNELDPMLTYTLPELRRPQRIGAILGEFTGTITRWSDGLITIA